MGWFKRKTPPELLSPLNGYNKWASTYAAETNPIKTFSDELITKFLPDLRGKSVLDVGCGTGKFCILAESHGAAKIHGIDLSPEMLNRARQVATRSTFECADISTATLEGTFDIVICSLVLGHIEQLAASLTKIINATGRGGTLILTDFHPFLTLSNSRRTFLDLSTGKTFEVRHYLHLFGEYFSILHRTGMRIEQFEEPMFRNAPVVFGIKAICER